jgi:hypothetical protein
LDTEAKTCGACDDSNCDVCTNGNFGQCATCKDTFTLVNGQCVSTATYEAIVKVGGVLTTVAFDGNLDYYTTAGGAPYLAKRLAEILGVQYYLIDIISVKQGSILATFRVYAVQGGAYTADELKALIASKYAAGDFNVYGTQITVSPSSNIISLTGCKAGQYLDSSSICRACPDDCDTCTSADEDCKKTNVGAIVGGVIGGVAFIVIVVIIYLKREAIKNLISPKGNYNKVASTPTNVQKA